MEANGFIVETDANASSWLMQSFTHAYYQGLLLEMGRMAGMATYVPNQDCNKPTDFQNSMLKYVDLQDFNVRMVIVADKRRRDE